MLQTIESLTYTDSVDAAIMGNHSQLQLRLPLFFILFIFLVIVVVIAALGWRSLGSMQIVHSKHHQSGGEGADEGGS